MKSQGVLTREDPLSDEIENILNDLAEALRVAVIGKTKGGKSTLINSLVGAHVAPTDTLSCTKFVAWYREAGDDWAQARLLDRRRRPVTINRWPPRADTPIADGIDDRAIEDIHVWRAGLPRLSGWTVIDTPGYNESEIGVRDRTQRLFENDSVDAVVFVLNGAAAGADEMRFFTDVRGLLKSHSMKSAGAIRSVPDDFGVVNTMAVLGRIDESDDGDPFGGAQKVIDQHADELRGIATIVIPVLGLLAETASQLTDDDFADLLRLKDLRSHQLSAGMFAGPAEQAGLSPASIERLGKLLRPYGLRFAVGQLRDHGVRSRADLSAALWSHSGVADLDQALRQRFTDRTDALKTRTAVKRLTRLSYTRNNLSVLRPYLIRILQLDGMHTLKELEALERWESGAVKLPAAIGEALKALALEREPAARVGLVGPASTEQVIADISEHIGQCDDFLVESWSVAADDVAKTMRKSYSLILTDLAGGDTA
jgi:hypothetical protein